MTLRSIAYLKEKFETGDTPSETDFIDLIDSLLHYTKLAVANGVATLDAGGKIPLTQIPSSIIGGLINKGFWDPNDTSVASDDLLIDGLALPTADAANKGWLFISDLNKVGFTRADFRDVPININAGDAIISNGIEWTVISSFQIIQSVNGQTGVVVLNKTDIGLSNVPNVDATLRANHTGTQAISTIVALQAALDALLPLAGGEMDDNAVITNTNYAGNKIKIAFDPDNENIFYISFFNAAGTEGISFELNPTGYANIVNSFGKGFIISPTDSTWQGALKANADHSGSYTARHYIDKAFAESLITALKDGVSGSGDTLQKLYNLIIAMSAPEVTVANIAARDAYNVTSIPFNIFVTDDGDSKWAYYKATTTGVGATFIKLSDQDTQHAVMSAASIKASYESNSDTNAFTNALLSKLNAIATGATANDTDANLKNRANHTGTQTASTISDFNAAALSAAPAETTTTEGALINSATAKATPVDADFIGLMDSAASNILKKLSWANIKATLKTYFDTLYLTSANTPTILYKSIVDSSDVTGTTAETKLPGILIEANSVTVGDIIEIIMLLEATGTAGSHNMLGYFNTTDSLSGATAVYRLNSSSNTQIQNKGRRDLLVKSPTSTKHLSGGTSSPNDYNTFTAAQASSNIDWTVDQYYIPSIQNGSSADSSKITMILLFKK